MKTTSRPKTRCRATASFKAYIQDGSKPIFGNLGLSGMLKSTVATMAANTNPTFNELELLSFKDFAG